MNADIILLSNHVIALLINFKTKKKMKKYWILSTALALLIVGLILNAKYGNMFGAGTYCRNYFAAGDYAMGIFASGEFSMGIFSAGIFSAGIFTLGIFSIGVFSISIFNIAFYSIGIFVIARKKRLPKLFANQSEECKNIQS